MRKTILFALMATVCSVAFSDITISTPFDNIPGATTVQQLRDLIYGSGDSTAIGSGSSASANQGTALGKEAKASAQSSTALGVYATASSLSSIAIGPDAQASGTYAIAEGMSARASGTGSISLGPNAVSRDTGIAIGNGTETGSGGISIGSQAKSTDSLGIAIGNGAQANGSQSIAIGRGAKANHTACVAIGPVAEATADNQMRISFSPDKIMIGLLTPTSLTQYIRDLAPGIDEAQVRSIAEGIAASAVANAKHFPTEDFHISGTTTTQVFKTTRTVSSPPWASAPYTATYKIEGLTEIGPSANRYGEVTYNYATNTIVRFTDGAEVDLVGSSFYARGMWNDIFISNPDWVRFRGAATRPEESVTLTEYIREVASESAREMNGGRAVDATPLDLSNGVICTDGKTIIYPHADGTWSTEK